MVPTVQFVTNVIVAVFIIGFVVAIEPVTGCLALAALGGADTIFYIAIRRTLDADSQCTSYLRATR